jgi:hypothetical protein
MPKVTAPTTPKSQTATLTTDPNTFTAEHVFDLAHITPAYINGTVLALTPDGETFGDSGIGVSLTWDVSRDGIVWANSLTFLHNQPPTTIGGVLDGFADVPRYLRVQALVVTAATAEAYAGPHHPTATVRIDVEYI